MPVFIRKHGALEIPPPTEKDWVKKDEEEDVVLKDPDPLCHLPQPVRMITKLVSFLFERAWEVIEENRRLQAPKEQTLPPTQYEASAEFEVSGRANCLATCGGYIFAGLSTGLCIFSIPECKKLCAWEATKTEICTIQVSDLGGGSYVLGIVDELGVARLLYYVKETLLQIKTMNEVEDITKRNVSVAMELSHGADYAGFLLQGSPEVCLEIYRLPKDSWLKEVEQAQATPAVAPSTTPSPSRRSSKKKKSVDVQGPNHEELDLHQILSRVESKLLPPALLLKVRPLKPLTGSVFKNPFEALMKSDDGNVLGMGYNHMIKDSHWEQPEAIFSHTFQQYLETEDEEESKEEKPSHAMFHFHLPGQVLPVGAEVKADPDVPIMFSVHWSKNHNISFYLLSRPPKEKLDSEPKPDLIWTCGAPITSSETSPCSSYMAVACEDGTITVWDLFLGFPLSVTKLPDGCVVRTLHFMPCSPLFKKRPPSPSEAQNHAQVQLLVLCLDGTLHLISSGAKGYMTKLLGAKPQLPGQMISTVASIPTLPDAVLIFFWNGTVNLMDATTQEDLYQFITPASYKMASPWQPVFSIDPDGQSLILQGEDQSRGGKEALLLFDLKSYSFMEIFASEVKLPPDSSAALPWDRRCDLFLNENLQRLSTISPEMPACWSRLQDYAATLTTGKPEEEGSQSPGEVISHASTYADPTICSSLPGLRK